MTIFWENVEKSSFIYLFKYATFPHMTFFFGPQIIEMTMGFGEHHIFKESRPCVPWIYPWSFSIAMDKENISASSLPNFSYFNIFVANFHCVGNCNARSCWQMEARDSQMQRDCPQDWAWHRKGDWRAFVYVLSILFFIYFITFRLGWDDYYYHYDLHCYFQYCDYHDY